MSLEDIAQDMREYASLARNDEPALICAHILDYANVIAAELSPTQPAHYAQAALRRDSHLAL